jgi:hypothetical protein
LEHRTITAQKKGFSMRNATVSRCALSFELLEQKALLAGDVGVAIVDGTVLINGDQEANHIRVITNAETNQIVVRGLPDADGVDTSLNGQNGPIVIDGVGSNIQIRTGNGNDAVDIPFGRFANVNVATGRGADVVRVGNLNDAAEPTAVATSESGDDASMAVAMASLDIATGRGADRVLQNDLHVRHNQRLSTGPGSDAVRLGIGTAASTDGPNVNVGGNLAVSLHLGDDVLTSQRLRVAGDAVFAGGRGADELSFAGLRNPGRTAIHAGSGADQVIISGAAVDELAVNAAAGHDRTVIVDSAFANLRVGMGTGNDHFALGQTSADVAILHGGEGRDRLVRLGGNQVEHFAVVAFERLVDGQPDDDESA